MKKQYGYYKTTTWEEDDRCGTYTCSDTRFVVTDRRIAKFINKLRYKPSTELRFAYEDACSDDIEDAIDKIRELAEDNAPFDQIEAMYKKAYELLTSTFYIVSYSYNGIYDAFAPERTIPTFMTTCRINNRLIKTKQEAIEVLDAVKQHQIEWNNPITCCSIEKATFLPTESIVKIYQG